MVWLYHSPIPVGKRGVIYLFKLFLPSVTRLEGRGGGARHGRRAGLAPCVVPAAAAVTCTQSFIIIFVYPGAKSYTVSHAHCGPRQLFPWIVLFLFSCVTLCTPLASSSSVRYRNVRSALAVSGDFFIRAFKRNFEVSDTF
jgi:hypothetical protein